MNRTTKINILAYASEPDKNYKYEGDIVDYKGKRYFVSLAEERVEFIGIKPYLIILHFMKTAPLKKLLIIWKAIGNYGYSG